MRCVPNGLCRPTPIAGLTVVFFCAVLTGCSSVSHVIADNWPRMLGGLPEGVPPRPDVAPVYMPVHDTPPPRDTRKMTPEERAKFEAELAEKRSQNAAQAEEVKSRSPGQLPPSH
jgi:hypothetical protein